VQDPQRSFTLVSFHAHPDDEALYTGGTLARAAAEGHRVVVVVATAGDRGLTSDELRADLGPRRLRELEASAAALGVSRVEWLGYADSGFESPATPPPGSFCAAPVGAAVDRLAAILRAEAADVLTVYDPNGGYGHRDHVRVHEVGLRAAQAAGTPVVLEATVRRELILRAVRFARFVGIRLGGTASARLASAYRPTREITHAIDVRKHLRAKRTALRAHFTQTSGGRDLRTVGFLLRLPFPILKAVLGTEWYVEVGRAVPARPLEDVFDSLRRPV
jgi:LmbE family N-acetylglucosaminyl deacetylase